MSLPYKGDSDPPGTPASVKSGIDITKFPATMSSTHSFLNSCPAKICKLDWNQAYKHIAVRSEDHNLQVSTSVGGSWVS